MKISFDIDNILIPYSDEFEVEKKRSILNLISDEKLRVGTSKLFRKLKRENHEIWIYTTSYRPIWKLKIIFAKYGLYPSGFINQKINQTKQKKHNSNSSKNPKLFGIDLHIDDSKGVKIEGDSLGFSTVIVDPNDKDWVNKVISEINRKQQKTNSRNQNIFYHEDDYKQVELVPKENLAELLKEAENVKDFSIENFDGFGHKDIYVRGDSKFQLIDKQVSKEKLERILSDFPLPKYCLLYTSPSPRDQRGSRMPSSA